MGKDSFTSTSRLSLLYGDSSGVLQVTRKRRGSGAMGGGKRSRAAFSSPFFNFPQRQ